MDSTKPKPSTINLQVYYESKFGEYLCVTGSIPQLGSWKEFKCLLKWTEGHFWVTEKPI
jgi:hypothetical protein